MKAIYKAIDKIGDYGLLAAVLTPTLAVLLAAAVCFSPETPIPPAGITLPIHVALSQ